MFVPSKFRPSWWLSNPHLQTVWSAKLRRAARIDTVAERLELEDGDFIDINWSHPEANSHNPEGQNHLVCIFHGLGGNIQSRYASHLIKQLNELGINSVFMHFRGCSGEPNRLASAYHSGHTDDIRYLIDLAGQRYPEKTCHAVGFSLGANALLVYLGEEGEKCGLDSAIAISPPLVLQTGADRLNSGASRIYQRHLLNTMKRQLREKQQHRPHLQLPQDKGEWHNFWQFDNEVTAPLSGFKDVHDYYTRCSSRQYLKQIGIKTHIIFANDDPFFAPSVVPTAAEMSPSVDFELCEKGGHVGFVDGPLTQPGYWLDRRITELLSARIN